MKYANQILWSDVEPNEVVRVISEKTLEIRPMKAELDKSWAPDMRVGGFVAHTVNNHEQRWIITSDETAKTVRIRKHANGQWKDKHGNRYKLADKPRKFHDYNF